MISGQSETTRVMGRMVAPWNLFPNGKDANLCKNFWVICMLSLNFQLVLGQVFLWTAPAIPPPLSQSWWGCVDPDRLFRPCLCGRLKIHSSGDL